MKTVDEQLASGEIWSHWGDIVDFTIDGVRIGGRPPEPRNSGRRGVSPHESRLDRRYREIVLIAHALHRAGYAPATMRTGNPDVFEPDVFADVEGGVWIEHTDLYPKTLAARIENAQLFEVRLRDAVAADHAVREAIGHRYLVFSFEAPPSSREIDEVCAGVMRYLIDTATDDESFSGVVPDAYPLLRKHGLYVQDQQHRRCVRSDASRDGQSRGRCGPTALAARSRRKG